MVGQKRQDENAVVYTIKQVCALYGVDVLRMQSRVVTVIGAAGRNRPMFVGQWTDNHGVNHASGMADLLARPQVDAGLITGGAATGVRVTVPLWIEAKSGKNRASGEQLEFAAHVRENGEHWLAIHDDVRPLEEWFKQYGVSR